MTANQNDLTTLATLKSYLSPGSSDDTLLQRLLTSASVAIENYLNRAIISKTISDVFDGTGGRVMVMPESPVTAVASVTINGNVIPAGSVTTAGFYSTANAIILNGYSFCKGNGNVAITYTAGYKVSGEAATIPATPYQVAAAQPNGSWVGDGGVTFATSGIALTKVTGTPTTGQYAVSLNGLYTFAAADTGLGVLITYNYCPYDLEQFCIGTVQYWLNDRQRGGETSRSMGGQTISYSQKDMPAWVQTGLNQLKRVTPV